ncbi:MAG: MFS transporter [Gammaproteobacteria bacterium]
MSMSTMLSEKTLSSWKILLLATAIGFMVANLYYIQPIAGPVSAALGLSKAAAGLLVTITQLGYSLGLFLLVPLGDLFENKKLILLLLIINIAGLAFCASATHSSTFLAAIFFVGATTATIQVILPLIAHMTPEATRGKVIGNVMSGLMLGIMLARPFSSMVTHFSSWHGIFWVATLCMVGVAVVLSKTLPHYQPTTNLSYKNLLVSMGKLALTTPTLRRRALYQAALFSAFSLFWTTSPLYLSSTFHFSQAGIAVFALVGITGVLAAPIAGRCADRGWTYLMTGIATLAVIVAFLITYIGKPGSLLALGSLTAAAILLDFGMTANLVLGQRTIFALPAEYRARFNSIYITAFFLGGAIGSALGSWSFAQDGWHLTLWMGILFPLLAFIYYLFEKKSPL